jgi:hypothetical protein
MTPKPRRGVVTLAHSVSGRGRWVAALALAATAIAGPVTAPPAAARTEALLPVRIGPVGLFTGLEGGKAPSHRQLLAIAHSSSVVIVTPARAATYGPTLKAANPAIALLVYENGGYSVPSDPSGMPESWFLHDSSGNRIQSAANPRNELMNPRSTAAFRPRRVTYRGWADYVTRVCRRDQTRLTSGCFLDALGPGPLSKVRNLNGRVPIDPKTGAPFTYRSYMTMQANYAAHVQARINRTLVANAFSSGNAYFTRSTYLIDRVGKVAGEAEVWMIAGTWQQNVQMLIDNGHSGSGCLVNYNAKPTRLKHQREYITASFLIGRGKHQYLQFSDSAHKSFEELSPLYKMRIGKPLHHYARLGRYFHHGVYRRRFRNGIAVANPGSHTVTFRLGGRYEDVNGKLMTSMTLASRSGVVLVRA